MATLCVATGTVLASLAFSTFLIGACAAAPASIIPPASTIAVRTDVTLRKRPVLIPGPLGPGACESHGDARDMNLAVRPTLHICEPADRLTRVRPFAS